MNSRDQQPGRENVRHNTNANTDEQQKADQYPGYPHYPSNEDITKRENNNGMVSTDNEYINLPDVNDIPGQENITVPPLGDLADVTISSADEEDLVSGDTLDDEDEDGIKIVMGTEADVTAQDLNLLEATDHNINLDEASIDLLDDTDDDAEPLNELNSPDDLDITGSELDDENEKVGEEDEENNYYSLGSDDNDEITEGTP